MKKFNYSKIFLLGFGFFGVSVIWIVYDAFVPLFLAIKFNLAPWLIGLFMTFDNIAALLIQPPVGAWSDRLRTPIGRRMPFILIGAPVGAIAFGLIPIAAILPLFVACTSTLLLSMAFWRTPVVALMPDITPSRFRSQANGIIYMMGGIGAIIASLVGSTLYEINVAFPFWMGSVLVILASVLVFIFIKEPKQFEEGEKQPNMFQSLQEVMQDKDKSGIRILLAIFFWFLSYSGIQAFLTLYATRHLGIPAGDAGRLTGHMAILIVLFAIVAGILGSRIGRRVTISIGIILLAVLNTLIALSPSAFLITTLAKLPLLGTIRVLNVFLMGTAVAWSLININSLPMVVDLTTLARVGTFTGLYFLFSTLAAIVGPNLYGWIVQLNGGDYNTMMFASPVFLIVALVLMLGVHRGEAVSS
jgi:maltose/moltooligosaccharide transporter